MKIKFQNLGSIKEAELDLRPLTVIIGPNNSNKTYLAYSIYGLWKQITDSLFANIEQLTLQISEEFIGLTINRHEIDIWSLEINSSFYSLLLVNIQHILEDFEGIKLESFFQDSSGKIFEKTRFEVETTREYIKEKIATISLEDFADTVDFIDVISKVEYNNNEIFLHFEYLHQSPEEVDGYASGHQFVELCRPSDSSFLKRSLHGYSKDRFFISDPARKSRDTSKEFDIDMIITIIFVITRKIFSNILPFPAERNAFINTYKMLANRRYKFLKETQRELFIHKSKSKNRQLELLREQDGIRYPQPVEDFLDFLSDIELENSPDPDPKNKNEFQQLADQIEEYIQNKNKTKFKNTKFGGKEIKVSVKRGLEIDLYNASSSIKQLAPLLLYLRYRAKVGDFLVIDEPEMNLHPESQVKLLEALSILVNLGVRVLLTTHSPYIMAHLNNIVNGNHDDQEILENQAQSLYLQDSQAFLKMDQVSAYEIKENKLLSLHDPDYGIRWDTLSDVSVDVQQKFFAIYEAGQKNSETNETDEE
jgi:ABC-type cobalamin/Fe3+-siderophores transport system ATPase subunit